MVSAPAARDTAGHGCNARTELRMGWSPSRSVQDTHSHNRHYGPQLRVLRFQLCDHGTAETGHAAPRLKIRRADFVDGDLPERKDGRVSVLVNGRHPGEGHEAKSSLMEEAGTRIVEPALPYSADGTARRKGIGLCGYPYWSHAKARRDQARR